MTQSPSFGVTRAVSGRQVTTFGRSHRYTERLCGEWRSSVHHLEVRKSLFGACDPAMDDKYGKGAGLPSKMSLVIAHIPRRRRNMSFFCRHVYWYSET